MTQDEKMTSFLFRLSKDLKQKLEKRAQLENKSVNATLQEIVSVTLKDPPKQVEQGSLEQRNFLGHKVAGKEIDQINGLVSIKGIYYRYLIEGNQSVNENIDYIVIEAVGNIITLRPLTTKERGNIMLGIKIVRQNCQGLVETLGKYSRSVEAGLHFYIPFIQRIQSVELAMHPLRLEKYSVITQDNAEIEASVTLNYR